MHDWLGEGNDLSDLGDTEENQFAPKGKKKRPYSHLEDLDTNANEAALVVDLTNHPSTTSRQGPVTRTTNGRLARAVVEGCRGVLHTLLNDPDLEQRVISAMLSGDFNPPLITEQVIDYKTASAMKVDHATFKVLVRCCDREAKAFIQSKVHAVADGLDDVTCIAGNATGDCEGDDCTVDGVQDS